MVCVCNNLRIMNRRTLWNPMSGRTEFEVIQECLTCGKIWVWSNLEELR